MRVTYPKWITNNPAARKILSSKLGLRLVESDERIEYSGASSYKSKTQIKAIQEMSITRYST